MIEIPEGILLANQLDNQLKHKKIHSVVANASPHGFAWYEGDPADYGIKFSGRTVMGAYSYGGKVHLTMSDDAEFLFADGIVFRYLESQGKLPKKHQLCVEFEDGSYLVASVRMYGSIQGYVGAYDNGYDEIARVKPSPLSDDFTLEYFSSLRATSNKKKLSVKAFLAAEQRIPGLGNGVLQDILFDAGISPRRDMATVGDEALETLWHSVRRVLSAMTELGGRDVETDLYGKPGDYKTLMSKNTYSYPCPRCGGPITREAFLGGSVYYCAHCQQ